MYSMKLAGKKISYQITKCKFKQSFLSSDIKVRQKNKTKTQKVSSKLCMTKKSLLFCKGLKTAVLKVGMSIHFLAVRVKYSWLMKRKSCVDSVAVYKMVCHL